MAPTEPAARASISPDNRRLSEFKTTTLRDRIELEFEKWQHTKGCTFALDSPAMRGYLRAFIRFYVTTVKHDKPVLEALLQWVGVAEAPTFPHDYSKRHPIADKFNTPQWGILEILTTTY